jgi:predicted GH43/DUF377 family glycosyl hydrolase
MWSKKGVIFNDEHAQLPVVDVLENTYKIYYSTRDKEGRSIPMFVEVDKKYPLHRVNQAREQILPLGQKGSFDYYGVMPTEIINFNGIKYMYYIGWSRRQDVPYHNALGLAISIDDGKTWTKFSDGPVFNTCLKEPGFIGTVGILQEDGILKMWYMSCREWFEYEGRMEPIYDIKYATSSDGIDWHPIPLSTIPLEGEEGGISSARVTKIGDTYHMVFSVRNRTGYRNDPKNAYRIMEAWSKDGLYWVRNPEITLGVTFGSEFDGQMVAYPYIVNEGNDNLIMFYNGNGFGNTGIGFARYQK